MIKFLRFLTFSFALFCASSGVASAQSYEPPLTNPSMAINLGYTRDWSTNHPFINVAKTARPWLGHLPGQWGGVSNAQLREAGHINEQGWPVSIPENVQFLGSLLFTEQPAELKSIRGRYRLTYKGEATLRLAGGARVISHSPGEIWFEYREGETRPVSIELRKINPANPMRNLAIVHEKHIPAFELGATFNPDYIDRIKDFRVLRFMGWQETNNSTVSRWESLPRLDDYTYSTGVPLELMIELANLVGADPWFCVPHLADDDLVRRMAETIKQGVKPTARVYVEYSNEMWNFGFQQAKWAQRQAIERWGRRGEGDGWLQFAGLKAAQVADRFDSIFGSEADDRLVNVISVQAATPFRAHAQLDGRQLKKEWDKPPSEVFDAYAITGYMWLQIETDQFIRSIKQWLSAGGEEAVFSRLANNLRNGSLASQIDTMWPEHLDIAKSHGLDMIMYEGGTHVVLPHGIQRDNDIIELLHSFNYSPQMDALYVDLLDGWKSVGGQLFNAFVDISATKPSGSWGNLRHLDDSTGRWDILSAHNRRPSTLAENRHPDAFKHGVFTDLEDGSTGNIVGTDFDDVLVGSDGDDLIAPGAGKDLVHGGDGVDQLTLNAGYFDAEFIESDGVVTAQHSNDQITFSEIEYIRFEGSNFVIATQDIVSTR